MFGNDVSGTHLLLVLCHQIITAKQTNLRAKHGQGFSGKGTTRLPTMGKCSWRVESLKKNTTTSGSKNCGTFLELLTMRCKGQEPNCSVFTSDDLMLATIIWHRSLSGSQGFLHRYVVKMCLQSLRPPPPFSGAWGRCTSTKILQDVAFLAAQRSLHFRSAYGTFWHAYLASKWFHHLHFHTKTSNVFCCTFCSELP